MRVPLREIHSYMYISILSVVLNPRNGLVEMTFGDGLKEKLINIEAPGFLEGQLFCFNETVPVQTCSIMT